MVDELTEFFAAAEAEFKWLVTDFGFLEVSRKSGRLFGSITWSTEKTFVEVVLEFPRPRIDVQFGALIRGGPPDIFDDANRHHLGALVVVRAHDEKRAIKLGDIPSLSKKSIQHGLRDNAKALRELAEDVLKDDHAIFKELAAFGVWQMSHYRAKDFPR